MDYKTLPHSDTGTITGCVTDVRSAEAGEDTVGIELESVAGERGWLVFTSDSPGCDYQWKTGYWYRFEPVIGCDPDRAVQTREERVTDALSTITDHDLLDDEEIDVTVCPVCGGPTDIETALSLESAVRQRLSEIGRPIHGIGQESLSITSLGPEAIDWRPQSREQTRRQSPIDTDTTVVCLDCGANVTDHYQERVAEKRQNARTAGRDERGGMQDIVQESFENPEPAMAEQASIATESTGGASASAPADVGMATGGAKDATNFRDNIHDGYVPHPDSLAYEGLFYDYYFDTGDTEDGESLFYPSYSTAVTESPLSGDVEHYLTVGLNSTLTEADLERKPLNLVAVVDVSGSMDSPFDQYYYDEHGERHEVTADDEAETKMAAARRALIALTEQLRDEDRFGVVLYSSDAHVAKPLRRVEETNMDAIRDHIQDITAGGGTDMSAGYATAMDLFEPYHGVDLTDVENRVVFMTDAMPNLGTTDRDDIVDAFETAATKHVHTTFVGIGLDTNADLVESITGVRGANHYFVHSTEEFTQRLADEFTYMVTPLVFDLSLDVVSDGYEIETVYGSPNADQATGEVMHVTTLFPSPTSDGNTRGGVTLLKLHERDPDASVKLVANWVERDGTQKRDATTLPIPAATPDQFENTGIRKAVLLSRYGRHLRNWMTAVRADGSPENEHDRDDWNHPENQELGEWEEQSVRLTVPQSYQEDFDTLRHHMATEIEQIGDETLAQELEILTLLSDPQAIDETRNPDDSKGTSHPETCPNCGESLPEYGPGEYLCPHCGITISE